MTANLPMEVGLRYLYANAAQLGNLLGIPSYALHEVVSHVCSGDMITCFVFRAYLLTRAG